MSSLDWFQIVIGFRYCLRRAITTVAAWARNAKPERLAVAEEGGE